MKEKQAAAIAIRSAVSPQCVICGTALEGPLGYLFRLFGINRSSRNPNLCSRCDTHCEEGRIVELTIFFADLTSFTELTHSLGPERTHQVVDAFLQMVTAAVVKYDGFIDKYVGDAVMAFFNVPLRRPDHAGRAVAAALEVHAGLEQLHQRFSLDLNAAVGIASGWARVGRLGSNDVKDYTAIGDVVNLAARLEGQARPGEIMIDRNAYSEIAGNFPDILPETLALKGFQEPVQTYRLRSAGDPPLSAPAVEAEKSRAFRLGAIIFAILGAPCAAAALLGPLAVVVGIGGLFGATSAFWIIDAAPIRIPVLILATLGALANLYTVWHAQQIRRQALAQGHIIPITQLERRRTVMVVFAAIATLLIVAFELYAHETIMGHSWP